MQVLLSLFVLLGIDAWFVFLFKRKTGEVLPLTVLAIAMVMVVFAYCDILPLGVVVIQWLGFSAYAVMIVGFIFRRDLMKLFVERYFSLGFYLFLLIYAFLFVLDYSRQIQNWDEIGYWSLRVKEMVRIDRLYNVPESLLPIHRDYPPFLACFQYFWCKLNGGFHDRWMYMSTHLLELLMLIPCVEYFNKDKKLRNVENVFLIFTYVVAAGVIVDIEDAAMLFKSIYSDAFMAVLSAYLLFFVFMHQKTDWFYRCNIGLGFAALMLSKPSGLGFFLIISIFMVIKWKSEFKDKEFKWRRLVVNIICMIIIPYLCYQIWEWHVIDLGVIRQFNPDENRNLIQFIKIFLGEGEAYQIITIENYLKGIIATPLLQRPISLVWWQIFLLTVALFEIVRYQVSDVEIKRDLRVLNIVSACAAIGYMFYMCVLYVFSYDRVEAVELASFRRYLNTYWMFIWNALLFIFISINAQRNRKERKNTVLWRLMVLLWVVWIHPEEVKKMIPVTPRISCSVVQEYIEDDDSIYVIQDKDDLYALTYFRYKMWPNKVTSGNSEEILEKMKTEKLIYELLQYDYLLVQDYNQDVLDKINIYPEEQNMFENMGLYKIKGDSSKMELEFVAKEW